MSGFAGVVCPDGASPDERVLERMAAALAFRGPDAMQPRTMPGAGFCFALLRTGPAPQSETQPCSVDGKVWLCGDVRLDGREELRELLQQGGRRIPAEATSEELALYAWQKWGEASFERLAGDFAFAIWDSTARRLFCARDLLGVRPFFYARFPAGIYFSNTLAVLRIPPEISANLDEHFIGDFLLQGWGGDAERTAFRDIRRLRQGHLLEFSNGTEKQRRFATLPIEEPLWFKRPEEYVEQFSAIFSQAVSDRLPRDRAIIFLSGGLDSTSVAAQAASIPQVTGQTQLHALTLDFQPLFEDEEGVYASQLAEHLKIPIEVFHLGNSVPFAAWQDPNFQTAEPSCEPFQASHLELYRRASLLARVALSGDGGDVILTGQGRSYFGYLLRQLRLGTLMSSFAGYLLTHRRLPALRMGIRARVRGLLGHKETEIAYPPWLDPRFERKLDLRERWKELQRPSPSSHPLHPEAYASLTGTHWANVLEDDDSASTGAPVEMRAPFLDLRMIRFLLRVPPVPWCMQKELLRQATRGILPEEIRLRPKVPLREDPLPLLLEKGCWTLPPPSQLVEASKEYVNWPAVCATSSGDAGYLILEKLRPVSLHRWLKGVEKPTGIQ
jgi:asparagine synthase (glutamine-hydrolysing)